MSIDAKLTMLQLS